MREVYILWVYLVFSRFSVRYSPIRGYQRFHNAISAKRSTPLVSSSILSIFSTWLVTDLAGVYFNLTYWA